MNNDVTITSRLELALRVMCESVIAEHPDRKVGGQIATAALAVTMCKVLLKYLHEQTKELPNPAELAEVIRRMPWEKHAAIVCALVCDKCREGEEHQHS